MVLLSFPCPVTAENMSFRPSTYLLPTSPLSERVMGPTEQAVNVPSMLLQPRKTSRDLGKAGKPLVTFTSHSCMTNKSLLEGQVWKHLGILPPLQILKGQPPPPTPPEACPVQWRQQGPQPSPNSEHPDSPALRHMMHDFKANCAP